MAGYNPYENMLHVLDKAAEVLGCPRNDYEFVRYPERELTVSIPVTMDDGHVEVFSGYRVQHSTAPPHAAQQKAASVSIRSPMKTKSKPSQHG